jgi:hypothetical protein
MKHRNVHYACVILAMFLFARFSLQAQGESSEFKTPSTQSVAYDDFERATLGSNWTITTGPSVVIGIVNNSDLGAISGPPNTGGGSGCEWHPNIFGEAQFSEAGISVDRPDSMLLQVYVRHRVSDNARYGFHWNNAFGGRWEIKYDGVPTASTRILASLNASPPLPGDTIRIESSGKTISGYLNGTLMISAQDTFPSAILTTGRCGLVFRYTTTFTNTFPVSVAGWWHGGDLISTALDEKASMPEKGIMLQSYPNPFSTSTNISFELFSKSFVSLNIFDALGRNVSTLVFEELPVGQHSRQWNGGSLPSGVYHYRLLFNDLSSRKTFSRTNRFTLLR